MTTSSLEASHEDTQRCEKVNGSIYPKPLRLHSQSTSRAGGRFTPRSRYALTEHKSRLGSLALPGLAMHSQSTSRAGVACAPRSRYAVLQRWIHGPLRIFLLRAGANACGCITEKLLPLNALAG
ncbi:hypothetical protein C8P63_10612 [Melghirimyces profundicolus]|uniref:Uncharacterized protein n=1 Tax=Melghirimyces profundicolus TaxID=1242148 RepID=A0A2T6C0C6_9BACL|nr:hypothetical protein C8P63_10612 [Melghirimyces profundicolus]